MSSARERGSRRESEREKYIKRPDATRRQTQKLSQHGPGIWPSAARATKATAVDTGVVPSLPPPHSPLSQAGQLIALFSPGFGFGVCSEAT